MDSKPKALLDYRKRGVADVVTRALSSYGDKVLLPADACEEVRLRVFILFWCF